MLKYLALIVVLLIASLAAFALLEQNFHSFQTCVSQSGTYNSDDYRKESANERIERLKTPPIAVQEECTGLFLNAHDGAVTGIATILLTAITGLLSVIAAGQFLTTRAQLRAYVGVVTGQWRLAATNDGRKHEVEIRIKNFGQTPAYNVVTTIGVEMGPKFTEQINRNQSKIDGNPTIFPDGTSTFKKRTDFVDPRGEEPIGIFVFGKITYKDAFGQSRWTDFRFTADAESGRLATCDDGNGAT